MTKIVIVLGTRPEIIKLAPLIKLAKKKSTDVIFSGQHYDYSLGLKFIDELGLRKPDYKMSLSKESPAKQMGQIIQKLADIFAYSRPDTVIVQGDTNTVLAASIASLKSKIPISHVEAGLRSFDWRMPEEHNRIATDHISELLFAPTLTSKSNLVNERVHGKIFVVGNTVIDAIGQNFDLALKKATVNVDYEFILLTLHRAENVDNRMVLGNILKAILESGERFVFTVHPRTMKMMKKFGYYDKIKNATNITMIDAVGYFDMISLMNKSKFILTDSGGIQEEATSPKIRKKVLVARKTTDRPEAVQAGLSEIVGVEKNAILRSIRRTAVNPKISHFKTPYGNGHASQKIIKTIHQYF